MPVTSVLEPVLEAVDWLISAGEIAWSVIEVGLMIYLIFGGGWLDMIRLISFWFDTLVIKYIDQFYSYFDKILANQIFAPDVVDGVMKRVYIFVSLLVLIKVMMLFMKYIANPELVSDEKLGASSLIKRVVLGMCGMLFLPTIFDLGIGIQKAVLSDNLFGKILLEESQIKEFEKDKHRVGRILAFNVYQAFWNIDRSQVTDRGIIDKYEKANTAYDPSAMGGLFSINEKNGDTYAIDYFPIASSVVLVYVLYLIIKYCLDVVVRMFKLFLLQMIGPLAISDYMINGDSKDVFKNWMKTTISVYAMLFVRIFSIWFIAFVTQLMKSSCPTALEDGICPDSLLYMGAEPDYLLRGIITLGLLALLMDLPKFFSDILGLDLEQDASVKGIMQKAGGALKGAAIGGLAIGGAAVGGAVGGFKNGISGLADKSKNKGKFDASVANKDAGFKQGMEDIQNNDKLNRVQKSMAMNKLRSNWMKDNKNAEETKEFKQANREANAKISAGASGFARGAMVAAIAATPGLKEAQGGYNQGKNTSDSHEKEREDFKNRLGSSRYQSGEKEYTKEAEQKEMQATQLEANQSIIAKVELDKSALEGKLAATAEITGVETSGVSGKVGLEGVVENADATGTKVSGSVHLNGVVDEADAGNARASGTVHLKGVVDEADANGAKVNGNVQIGAEVSEVEVGKVSGGTAHVSTEVEQAEIQDAERKVITTGDTSIASEDSSAELNLTVKKKETKQVEYSVFDDPSNLEHIDG